MLRFYMFPLSPRREASSVPSPFAILASTLHSPRSSLPRLNPLTPNTSTRRLRQPARGNYKELLLSRQLSSLWPPGTISPISERVPGKLDIKRDPLPGPAEVVVLIPLSGWCITLCCRPSTRAFYLAESLRPQRIDRVVVPLRDPIAGVLPLRGKVYWSGLPRPRDDSDVDTAPALGRRPPAFAKTGAIGRRGHRDWAENNEQVVLYSRSDTRLLQESSSSGCVTIG